MSSLVVQTNTFPITGMSCASCASSVETIIAAQPGVETASVNLAAETLNVVYHPEVIAPLALQDSLRSAGYDLIINDDKVGQLAAARLSHINRLKRNLIGATLLTLPVSLIAMVFMTVPYRNWLMLFLTIPVLAVFGRQF